VLVRDYQGRRHTVKQSWAVPRRAINLMEALRRSIAEDKKAEARRPAPARKRA
jgi:non-homologous end joining protein Ku